MEVQKLDMTYTKLEWIIGIWLAQIETYVYRNIHKLKAITFFWKKLVNRKAF